LRFAIAIAGTARHDRSGLTSAWVPVLLQGLLSQVPGLRKQAFATLTSHALEVLFPVPPAVSRLLGGVGGGHGEDGLHHHNHSHNSLLLLRAVVDDSFFVRHGVPGPAAGTVASAARRRTPSPAAAAAAAAGAAAVGGACADAEAASSSVSSSFSTVAAAPVVSGGKRRKKMGGLVDALSALQAHGRVADAARCWGPIVWLLGKYLVSLSVRLSVFLSYLCVPV